MRKVFIILFCLTAGFGSLRAQSYIGYTYNNYETAAGMAFNPASIAGSAYKFDLNLFSGNIAVGSNAFSINRSSLFRFNVSEWVEGTDYSKLNNSDPKDMWQNLDIIGPSFMLSLSPKHSIGFTSRMRFLTTESNLSNDIFQLIGSDKENAIFGQTFTQDNQSLYLHGFADFGLTYARVLYANDHHKVKAGLTAKYVVGLASGAFRANNVNVNLQSETEINNLQGTITAAYSKGVDDMVADDVRGNKFTDYVDAETFAADFGLVYEWASTKNLAETVSQNWFRPTSYKLRAAVSLNDIGGKLKYDASANSGDYTVNMTNVSTEVLNLNDRSLDEYIADLENSGYISMTTPKSLNMSLPTILRANVDWQAWKRIYVNFDGAFNLVGKNAVGSHYISSYAVTPRYESRWFSIYSPVSYDSKKNLGWGVGINVGVFYVGSGTVLSNVIRNEIKNMDIHFGLHVPIFRSKHKSKAEPVQESIVLPVPEEVVNEPKIAAKKPVPAPQPIVETPRPEPVVVIPEPTVSPEVQEEVDRLANSIYFVKGSDWLLVDSREPLTEVAMILNNDPDLYLNIIGYADADGTEDLNMVLSKQRAESAKKFLVDLAIDPNRITTLGHGEEDPVADNSTTAGKARNRRVEMKLSY